jgi:WD40 repeat protein
LIGVALEEQPNESALDELSHQQSIRASSNVRAFAFSPATSKPQLMFALADNRIEVLDLKVDGTKRATEIVLPGHPSDIRSVCISHDDTQLLTTSQRMHAQGCANSVRYCCSLPRFKLRYCQDLERPYA